MNVEQAAIELVHLVQAHGEEKHKDALKILTQEIDVLRSDKRRAVQALRRQGENK